MKRIVPAVPLVALLLLGAAAPRARAAEPTVAALQTAFEQYSGTRLVFRAADLPPGRYHDAMPALPEADQVRAARIALREVHKLPPGYLGAVGLKAIGIFQACMSQYGDGFRPYDEKLKGYRYYGIYNGKDAVAAAYYTDGQLPLTLHHEIFHHVDATTAGKSDVAALAQDDAFDAALSGKAPYPAVKLPRADLAALEKRANGTVLENAVSAYAKKNSAEDKAETARHFLTNLPDALVQVATHPDLPGSQRILHVLHKYEAATPARRTPPVTVPNLAWFVDVALGRVKEKPAAPTAPREEKSPSPRQSARGPRASW